MLTRVNKKFIKHTKFLTKAEKKVTLEFDASKFITKAFSKQIYWTPNVKFLLQKLDEMTENIAGKCLEVGSDCSRSSSSENNSHSSNSGDEDATNDHSSGKNAKKPRLQHANDDPIDDKKGSDKENENNIGLPQPSTSEKPSLPRTSPASVEGDCGCVHCEIRRRIEKLKKCSDEHRSVDKDEVNALERYDFERVSNFLMSHQSFTIANQKYLLGKMNETLDTVDIAKLMIENLG